MAVVRFLLKTFATSFYRKNAIFFGVLIFFFVLVVRPPTFFFSADFVGILLEDWRATAAVLALAFLYSAYAMRFLLTFPAEPAQGILLVLPAMGRARLWLQLLPVTGAVLAPAVGYLMVMVVHAVGLQYATGIACGLAAVLIWAGCTWWLQKRLLSPLVPDQVRSLRLRISLPRSSMPMIYWGFLRRRHRSATFVTKAVSLLLLGLLLISEVIAPNPYPLIGLTFLLVGMLHSFLVFRLRNTEEEELSWFRNLPFSGWRKWGQWGATLALICFPEIAFFLLLMLREGLNPIHLLHFSLCLATFWWLPLGLTYLNQVRPQDLSVLVWSLFFGLFVALLFRVEFALLYLPLLALSAFLYLRLHR